MRNNRPAIPIAIRRQVPFEARHHCAVCCGPLPLQQAHIIPWNKVRVHTLVNLIALCANCHSRADNEKWGVETLRKYKEDACILAQRSNAPDSTNAHLVQLLEIFVDKKFEEMMERSAEFASMIAAYTVKIQSIAPANSCRVVIQLPERAAQILWQHAPTY